MMAIEKLHRFNFDSNTQSRAVEPTPWLQMGGSMGCPGKWASATLGHRTGVKLPSRLVRGRTRQFRPIVFQSLFKQTSQVHLEVLVRVAVSRAREQLRAALLHFPVENQYVARDLSTTCAGSFS